MNQNVMSLFQEMLDNPNTSVDEILLGADFMSRMYNPRHKYDFDIGKIDRSSKKRAAKIIAKYRDMNDNVFVAHASKAHDGVSASMARQRLQLKLAQRNQGRQ